MISLSVRGDIAVGAVEGYDLDWLPIDDALKASVRAKVCAAADACDFERVRDIRVTLTEEEAEAFVWALNNCEYHNLPEGQRRQLDPIWNRMNQRFAKEVVGD